MRRLSVTILLRVAILEALLIVLGVLLVVLGVLLTLLGLLLLTVSCCVLSLQVIEFLSFEEAPKKTLKVKRKRKGLGNGKDKVPKVYSFSRRLQVFFGWWVLSFFACR